MARKIVHPLELSVIAAVVGIAVVGWLAWKFLAGPPTLVESDRVKHPMGFSIIRPPDWDFYLRTGTSRDDFSATIDLRPHAFKGQSPSIVITRLKQTPTTQELESRNFKPAPFQGQPAMISDIRRKAIRMIKIEFKRDDSWYQISTELPQWESVKEDAYMPILNTFHLSSPYAETVPTTALAPLLLPPPTVPPHNGAGNDPTTLPSP